VSHAHNGYLDLLLQVGLLGSLIFALAVSRALIPAFADILTAGHGRSVAILTVGTIFVVLAVSMTESRLATALSVALIAYLSTLQENMSGS